MWAILEAVILIVGLILISFFWVMFAIIALSTLLSLIVNLFRRFKNERRR